MPGLDLSRVSSNWKKLQETLQSEKKTARDDSKPRASTNSSTKRKRPQNDESRTNRPSASKKQKFSSKTTIPIRYPPSQRQPPPRNKMGFMTSKPTPPSTTSPYTQPSSSTSHTALAHNHDISQADLALAYGSSSSSKNNNPNSTILLPNSPDIPNIGLHPTHKSGKYISLDCEMVGTGAAPHFSDHVLARVSVVNFHGEQLYDSYVIPPPHIPIRDYRTAYSGIRPHQLLASNGARPFDAVQRDVASLLEGKILVGHALRNDLTVLVLKHPGRDIRDTSRFEGFRREIPGRKKPALRMLVEKELGVKIQQGEHSSLEDARATMALFRLHRLEMEAEMRRKYGGSSTRAVVGGGGLKEDKKGPGKNERLRGNGGQKHDEDGDDDEVEDDNDDVDLLDGEEDVDGDLGEDDVGIGGHGGLSSNGSRPGVKPKKSKNKKKKRTKRK